MLIGKESRQGLDRCIVVKELQSMLIQAFSTLAFINSCDKVFTQPSGAARASTIWEIYLLLLPEPRNQVSSCMVSFLSNFNSK